MHEHMRLVLIQALLIFKSFLVSQNPWFRVAFWGIFLLHKRFSNGDKESSLNCKLFSRDMSSPLILSLSSVFFLTSLSSIPSPETLKKIKSDEFEKIHFIENWHWQDKTRHWHWHDKTEIIDEVGRFLNANGFQFHQERVARA